MSKTKLRECRFCGSEPLNNSFTIVRCFNDECPISGRWMTKKEWNARTPDPRIAMLVEAFETVRDAIFNERGPLAESNAGPDVINAVLGILDDEFSAALKAAKGDA